MKSILNELGVVPYINAHDTITLYGASRMEESAIEAMNQMAECFLPWEQAKEKRVIVINFEGTCFPVFPCI